MIIIVFLFHYRGDNENDSENVRWNGNECEHVGPVDPVGPVIRCQCYQHWWLFLPDVMYSTMMYIWKYTVI